jgi:hypothetical protein
MVKAINALHKSLKNSQIKSEFEMAIRTTFDLLDALLALSTRGRFAKPIDEKISRARTFVELLQEFCTFHQVKDIWLHLSDIALSTVDSTKGWSTVVNLSGRFLVHLELIGQDVTNLLAEQINKKL